MTSPSFSRKLRLAAFAAIPAIASAPTARGVDLPGDYKVRDVAIKFRMNAGYPGDINRAHVFSTEDCLIDPTNPPTAYGQIVFGVPTSGGVRTALVGDVATNIFGLTVRPYPVQQTTGGMSSAFGNGVPPITGIQSVLRLGYIMTQVYGAAVPTKFGAVYMYNAASGGGHVLGGLEAAAGANLVLVPNLRWNGAPDANGVTEVIFNV